MPDARIPKAVRWMASSKEDLSSFPDDVKRRVGLALFEAQMGRKAIYAKPLKGYGGASVLEVVDGDTFRTVYTVQFAERFTCSMPFKRNRGAA
jgi:phage-related protein